MASAREVTARIVLDERFKPGALEQILAQLDEVSIFEIKRSDVVRARALVSLRVEEEAVLSSDAGDIDAKLEVAEKRMRDGLALNPTDSFLWLMLYSITSLREGFSVGRLSLLDQSYQTGPLEGWIVLRRNKLGLGAFSMLDDLRRMKVVSEFAELVDSNFIEVAEVNLTGVGWLQRERLLAGLADVNIISREALSRKLKRDGVTVHVPGVEVDERWWR